MEPPEGLKSSSDNTRKTMLGSLWTIKRDFWTQVTINRVNWLFLVVLFVSFLIIELAVHPHNQFIGPREYDSILFPHSDENTIPTWAVPLIAMVFPIMFVCVIYGVPSLIGKITHREFHDLIFGILMAIAITANITSILKELVGRPRPDFAARCFPDLGVTNLRAALEEADGYPDCQGLSGTVEEGRKSFPSGHTSWTMCSMTFLMLLLTGKLQPYDGNGRIWKMVITILPFLGGVLIGITRINDYWHHWTDVLAGGILGVAVAIAVYCAYYPWPFNRSGSSRPLYIVWEETTLRDASSSQESTLDSLEPLRVPVARV